MKRTCALIFVIAGFCLASAIAGAASVPINAFECFAPGLDGDTALYSHDLHTFHLLQG